MRAAQRQLRKLNLGCGFDIRKGYLNVDVNDFHKPDLVGDITSLPMLAPDYYEEIVAQDVLEHIPRAKTRVALREWARLLATGGVLKLRVPNLLGLLNLFRAADKQAIAEQRNLVQCLYGTQAYGGDFHLSGYTPRLLAAELAECGLMSVNMSEKDHWLLDVVASKRFRDGAATPMLLNDAICVSGWHSAERSGTGHLRWTDGRALLDLAVAGGREVIIEMVTQDPSVAAEPLKVELRHAAAQAPLHSLRFMTTDIQRVSVQVPSDEPLVEVSSSRTWAPRFSVPNNKDGRLLGIGVTRIEMA
jgi:hypothetical protein